MNEHTVILFDGVCNFCSGIVKFIIRQDKKNIFRFAALQSGAGQKLLEKYKLPKTNFDSFILLKDEKIYHSSSAALKLLNELPWYWKWSQLFWIVPRFIRNGAYNMIARNRYKWFGRKDECLVPSPEDRNRFLENEEG